jgi:hypothetical protein
MKHRGGICYLPAKDSEKVIVERVPNGNGCMDVNIEGDGVFAVLQADEQIIEGTLQLPADVVCDKLLIKRTPELPVHPMLNYALDMQVKEVKVCGKKLQFVCNNDIHTPIWLLSSSCPTVTINGETVSVEWQAEKQMAWIDRRWQNGDVLVAEIS